MIKDDDRAYWFGASDSQKILTPNHNTKSWEQWWRVKMGIEEQEFHGNEYTRAGQMYEHPILDAFDRDINKDRQLYLEDLRLRVNYDGDKNGIIYEVKTHKIENPFEITPYIYAQCQTQMYVWKEISTTPFINLYILSYGLTAEERRILSPVDADRIKVHKVKYSKGHMKRFLKSLKPLVERLDNMRKPSIMQAEKRCYLTGYEGDGLDCHHIFFGSGNRRISDENGFWVWLRHDMHIQNSYNQTPHNDKDVDLMLKRECQKKFEETHSREEFMELVGRNYLD